VQIYFKCTLNIINKVRFRINKIKIKLKIKIKAKKKINNLFNISIKKYNLNKILMIISIMINKFWKILLDKIIKSANVNCKRVNLVIAKKYFLYYNLY